MKNEKHVFIPRSQEGDLPSKEELTADDARMLDMVRGVLEKRYSKEVDDKGFVNVIDSTGTILLSTTPDDYQRLEALVDREIRQKWLDDKSFERETNH